MMTLGIWSDVTIWASYIAISIWLIIVTWPKATWLQVMFALFIVSCGLTHGNTAWAVSHGFCDANWWWANACKIETAIVSIPVAIAVILMFTKQKIAK